MPRPAVLLAFLIGIGLVNANFFLRTHECNPNERHQKVTVFENKTVNFECVKILCGDKELKLDDERNCTESRCLTTNLATIKHIGVQILELGQFYEGGVTTKDNSSFDFIASYKPQDNKMFVWVDRLTCKDSAVSTLSHEVEEILVKNLNNQSQYGIQGSWEWFKQHLFRLRPQEKMLFVYNQYTPTKLVNVNENVSVVEVKTMLRKSFGYPAEQQQLYFNDDLLEDNKKLSDYRIPGDSSIRLELFEKLHLMTQTGKVSSFLVKQHFSFDELKAEIAQKTNISVAKQQIFFEGELLTGESFKTHDIQSGSILLVHKVKPAQLLILYDSRLLVIEASNGIDELSANDLYSRTENHFNLNSPYRTMEIRLNGNRITKDRKLSEQGVKDGSLLTVTNEPPYYYYH